MPVPTLISDLSQTASSNYPAGSESPGTIDDYHRALCSFVAILRDTQAAKGANTDITSLAAPALGSATATTQATSDNSTKVATTAWARLYAVLGFSASIAANGYVVFPTWLGGWILQWYQVTSSAAGEASGTFPLTFPNAVYVVLGMPTNGGGSGNIAAMTGAPNGLIGRNIGAYTASDGVRVAVSVDFIAIGR